MKVDWPQRVADLQNLLLHDEDFSKTISYFFDNFGENLDFLRTSKKLNHPSLLELINAIIEGRFKQSLARDDCLFQRSPLAPELIHGMYRVENRTGMFIFFGALNKGMLAIPRTLGSDMVDYMRFTTIQLPNGTLGLVPGDPSRLH